MVIQCEPQVDPKAYEPCDRSGYDSSYCHKDKENLRVVNASDSGTHRE